MTTFTFATPKRKKRAFCKKESPFPIPIATVSGRPANPDNWEHYTGHLVDGHVIISDKTDADLLYKMGFFGKGTLSRSQLEYGQLPPSLKRRNKQTESSTMERTLQVVSRRKYLCHMNWSHKSTVQKGGSPADCHSDELDDIVTQDDQLPSVSQRHHTTSTQDFNETAPLPCRHQDLGDTGPVSAGDAMGLGNKEMCKQETECDREKDPWSGGDSAETLQFWGTVPDKAKETMDWEKVGEDEAREFWGILGETDKGDTGRDSQDVSLVVTAGTDETAQSDGVTKRTIQNDDITQRTTQSDVTQRTAQYDDVTLRTTQSDDVTLRTTQSDDVTLRTTQCGDVTLRTTQSDDVTLTGKQIEGEENTQNIPHLKEWAINVCDPVTSSNQIPYGDIPGGKSSLSIDPRSSSMENGGDWFVVPDSWDSDQKTDQSSSQLQWQPVVKCDPFKLHECLQLSLVEAFFLSYGLGCLTVVDLQKGPLNVTEMWCEFCQVQKNFLRDYVAYHNFRSKGWVPKTGLKYGAEFILYKDGPPFYHASYSVMVRLVTHDLEDDLDNRPLTWTSLAGLNRMTEQVGKEVMFCYVIKPKDISAADLQSPSCLSHFTVQEVILRRWVSAQERGHVERGDMP